MAEAFKGSRHPQCRPPVHAGNRKETGYGKDVWSMLLTKKTIYDTWHPARLQGTSSSLQFCSGRILPLGPL